MIDVQAIRTTTEVSGISCASHVTVVCSLVALCWKSDRAIAFGTEFYTSHVIFSVGTGVDALFHGHLADDIDRGHETSMNRVNVASLADKVVVRLKDGRLSGEHVALIFVDCDPVCATADSSCISGTWHSTPIRGWNTRRANRIGAIALVSEFDARVSVVQRETFFSALWYCHRALDVDAETEGTV